jgi:hypothetical protein
MVARAAIFVRSSSGSTGTVSYCSTFGNVAILVAMPTLVGSDFVSCLGFASSLAPILLDSKSFSLQLQMTNVGTTIATKITIIAQAISNQK